MRINDLLINTGRDSFYKNGFRDMIEDHLTYLLQHEHSVTITVTNEETQRFKGDLFGLLKSQNVATEIIWIVMRINGYFSSIEYDGSRNVFIIPDYSIIESLLQRHETSIGTI